MDTIKQLFDQSKDIYRTIEKVITYSASQEHRLKAEISEYIVTESIDEQFGRLLTKMQAAMDSGGENEVGVWVSGFYGSGKSSFTKYLGFAFHDGLQVEGTPFLKHLQNRLITPQTKALFSAVTRQFPAAVIMLDLASEQVTGATMTEVSNVLYYKVLQWAGFSRNLKVAALERRLQLDGRSQELIELFRQETKQEWTEYQNDELVVDSLLPGLAHTLYPELFKTPASFTTATSDYIYLQKDRVKEIIDIIRTHSGKDHILFIIDEVGQYVGSQQHKILDLQGLAENLKRFGDGKVWIVGTAQQTLTEDDPRAALNSPELYKLKDRFPVQIDLDSRDIKEICYRRLLGKSPGGATALEALFTQHGQSLRHNTKLQEARYYDSDFTQTTFINLYPFLPAHFGILLNLLSALAKSTGGFGLRSAIKIVQDILIEGADEQPPFAEQSVGNLVTTMTIYDALAKEIKNSGRHAHFFYMIENKVKVVFQDSPVHHDVAKTVAILQMLGNLPVTVHNVASLMHPAIDAASRLDEVQQAVDDLIGNALVPFGEQDGNLCFFSEKLNDIEQDRAQLPLRTVETRRMFNEALREVFSPLPATRLHGTLTVTTGIKSQQGSLSVSLAGERETIQTVIEFVEAADYDTMRTRLVEESRHRSSQQIIYLLGRNVPEIDDKVADIYRSKAIVEKYGREPDAEVKDYCRAQNDRVAKVNGELQQVLRRCLARGAFLFRGQITAVESLAQDVTEACKKQLAEVAGQVFDRYAEAPVRAQTSLAEKFLRAWPRGITTELDPLELIRMHGGQVIPQTDRKAVISIRDYIERNGMVEGKRLSEYFSSAPFGWSPDTLRYLVSVLLVAGEIKLKVAGRDVTVNGQQALDALKTNNSFKTVGVALREERPSLEVSARAAARLTELIGEPVDPLEDEISKTATKHLPRFQSRFAPLGEKLIVLELPGTDRIASVIREIADLLFTDASDAPQRLGGEESALYDDLKWAAEVHTAFKQGVEQTIRALQQHRREITNFPDSGVPGQLRRDLADDLEHLRDRLSREDFYTSAPDLNTLLTTVQAHTRDAASLMQEGQRTRIQEAEQEVCSLPEWRELTQEEQDSELAELGRLPIEVSHDLDGLKRLINQEFVIHSRVNDLKNRIVRLGRQRREERRGAEHGKESGRKEARHVTVPATITRADQLETLIRQLQELKELALYNDIEVTIVIET